MALDRMHWLGHGEPAMIETVRGAQDQWQAIGLATAVASAVLVGAVLLAAIRPSGREHGPALLVLLATLLLASLVALSVGQSEVTADGSTLAEVLDDLESNHSGIKARVLDYQGAIRRFVNVYVGNDDGRFLESLETPTPEGVQISIIPAVAGGGS